MIENEVGANKNMVMDWANFIVTFVVIGSAHDKGLIHRRTHKVKLIYFKT